MCMCVCIHVLDQRSHLFCSCCVGGRNDNQEEKEEGEDEDLVLALQLQEEEERAFADRLAEAQNEMIRRARINAASGGETIVYCFVSTARSRVSLHPLVYCGQLMSPYKK